MNWLPIAAASLALLFLAGCFFVIVRNRKEGEAWPFGLLAAGVGGFALMLAMLDHTGTLVHSGELGLTLLQGRFAALWLWGLVTTVSLAVGGVLGIARRQTHHRRELGWAMIIAIAVALASVPGIVRVEPANAAALPASLKLYAYDLWWPPLVLWTVLGTLGSAVTYAYNALYDDTRRIDRPWRLLTMCLAGAAVSAVATGQAHFESPVIEPSLLGISEGTLWWISAVVFTACALGLSIWLLPQFRTAARGLIAVLRVRTQEGRRRLVAWARESFPKSGPAIDPTSVAPAANDGNAARTPPSEPPAILAAAGAPAESMYHTPARIAWVATFILGFALPEQGRRVFLLLLLIPTTMAVLHLGIWLFTGGSKDIGKTGPSAKLAAIAFLTAVATASDLWWFSIAAPAISLGIMTVACGTLAVIIAYRKPSEPITAESVAATSEARTRRWKAASAWLVRLKEWFTATGKAMVTANSIGSAVLKVAVGLLLLVVLAELPDRGKTVVRAFSSYGAGKDSDIGNAVSDRVYYRLRMLYDEMATESLMPETMSVKPAGEPVGTAISPGSSDVALGHSEKIDVSGVQIPVAALAQPIQKVLRGALHTRSVRGVVNIDSASWLTVAVAVDGGRTMYDSAFIGPRGLVKGDTALRKIDPRTVESISQRLAFAIATDARSPEVPGMTTSWPAYLAFRSGLRAWKEYADSRYTRPKSRDALVMAIDSFHAAVTIDPYFAIGHFRLAEALHANGDEFAAREAYRQSLQSRAYLPAAANALAFSLLREGLERHTRVDIWRRILTTADGHTTPVDRASALLGFCQNYVTANSDTATDAAPQRMSLFDEFRDELLSKSADVPHTNDLQAYFYCKSAARVYRYLPAPLASHANARRVEGEVEYQLGNVLQRLDRRARPVVRIAGWQCDPMVDSMRVINRRYATAAINYLRESIRLAGEYGANTATASCRIAMITFAQTGEPDELTRLKADPNAHERLAEHHAAKGYASLAAGDLRAADTAFKAQMREYAEAMRRRRGEHHFLNQFAYAIWKWRHDMREPYGPSTRDLDSAEAAARQAIAVTPFPAGDKGITAKSTLGEVLLAEGRPVEARIVLDKIMPEMPNHYYSNEIRQDYARAIICSLRLTSGKGVFSAEQIVSMTNAANAQLAIIRSDIAAIPSHRADIAMDELTPDGIAARCHAPPTGPANQYVLRSNEDRAVTSMEKCRWTGVSAAVAGGNVPYLHIRGPGGVPRSRADGSINWIAADTIESFGLYFAQLEDSIGNPLSAAIPLRTRARCNANESRLHFGMAGAVPTIALPQMGRTNVSSIR